MQWTDKKMAEKGKRGEMQWVGLKMRDEDD